ncbi:hypothetical protein ACU8V7_04295 [Zobellia nedashkovskayae]
MKTILISAMLIGGVAIGYSQGTSKKPNLEIAIERAISAPKNIDYLNKVQVGIVSPRVLELQHSVANFNLSKSTLYKVKDKHYIVYFRKTKGLINATFDAKGKILYSMGRFKDVIFPLPVRNTIYNTHPGWYVLGNTYKTTYSLERGAESLYKVMIGKGTLVKRLRIDGEGNLL